MIRTAEEVFPEAIFAVHLDHGTEEVCYDCIDSGFYSSVMIDASHETFDKNIAITRRVVERAHDKGISVEAELGMLGGVEEDISVDADNACLTDPDQAVEFVERSGCDSLAVAIGTSHGAYKFTGKQGLHFDRIAEIQKLLPGFPLVMHGSSSVPKEWVDRINKAGGKLGDASGVPEDQYLPAAKLGVTKVNIDTDGRLVWCAVYRETFRDKPDDFDPRTAGQAVHGRLRRVTSRTRTEKLGSAGPIGERVRADGQPLSRCSPSRRAGLSVTMWNSATGSHSATSLEISPSCRRAVVERAIRPGLGHAQHLQLLHRLVAVGLREEIVADAAGPIGPAGDEQHLAGRQRRARA